MILIHRYKQLDSQGAEDEDSFVVNNAYQCEIMLTNQSAKRKQVDLLYCIPNGSLPLRSTKYVESSMVTLDPYSTKKKIIVFYFPGGGEFQHNPSNMAENGVVVAKSP